VKNILRYFSAQRLNDPPVEECLKRVLLEPYNGGKNKPYNLARATMYIKKREQYFSADCNCCDESEGGRWEDNDCY
jgi:hypothetical protein